MAESGIVSVEELAVFVNDEELAGSGVGVGSSCHGNYAFFVGNGVLGPAVGSKFAVNFGFAAAGSVTGRVTALDHKAFDDAVESKTIEKAFFNKCFKVCNGFGCGNGIEFDHHGAVAFDIKFDHIKYPPEF